MVGCKIVQGIILHKSKRVKVQLDMPSESLEIFVPTLAMHKCKPVGELLSGIRHSKIC